MSKRDFELKAFQDLAFPVKVGAPVISRPATEAGSASGSTVKDSDRPALQKVLVLLTGSDICLQKSIADLKELKARGCYMTLVYSAAAEQLLDTAELEKSLKPDRVIRENYREGLKNLVQNTDLFVVPNLTQNTLAKTAVGIQDELAAILLWQCLMNGVKTIIGTTSIFHGWFEADDNTPMKRVMEGHVRTLVSYGAIAADQGELGRYLSADVAPKESVGRSASGRVHRASGGGHYGQTGYQTSVTPKDRYPSLSLQGRSDTAGRKKVITEDDIRSYREKELTIERGTLITPSALDLAKLRDIRIIRGL